MCLFLVFFSKLQVPKIVKALHKQLKEKSIKSRQGCFSLLTELANVLPGCLADHIPALVPGKLVRGLGVKEQGWLSPFLTRVLLACVFHFYSCVLFCSASGRTHQVLLCVDVLNSSRINPGFCLPLKARIRISS